MVLCIRTVYLSLPRKINTVSCIDEVQLRVASDGGSIDGYNHSKFLTNFEAFFSTGPQR
jgi:hypothetical protein